MVIRFTDKATRDHAALQAGVRTAFKKQLGFLLANLRHPSLHAKKYDESRDVWQARVSRNWRFYFTVHGDAYVILAVIPHPK
jgi:mRNA-degrading endonuclease RelE of RelBE toxin-antitoxin system